MFKDHAVFGLLENLLLKYIWRQRLRGRSLSSTTMTSVTGCISVLVFPKSESLGVRKF